MSHLGNLIGKELKELITPSSVASIVAMAVLFGMMGGILDAETDRISAPPTIGVLSGGDMAEGDWDRNALEYIYQWYDPDVSDPAEYVKIMFEGNYHIFSGDSIDAGAVSAAMNELGVNVLLVFDENYSANINAIANGDEGNRGEIRVFWNEIDTGLFGTVSTAVVGSMIAYVNMKTSENIITNTNPLYVLSPVMSSKDENYTVFSGKLHEGITPADISSALQSQSFLMPILMMIIITMIGGMIISSMGNEKENKTLETLLTMPVKRTTIVSGKLIGSAIAGLVFGIVYLAGMYFYMNSALNVGTVSMGDLGLTLSIMDWGIAALMIFLAILSALGMCMIIGAFVKDYKAAQTLTMPITILAMIPMFVIMFADFNTLPSVLQTVLFAIPFTHPMMVMNNLMLGDMIMVFAGLGYLALFSLLTIYITVRIYNSDILLTGIPQKKGGILSVLTRK
jgi:ABC-2 type transport system permease protein